jgi:hypothetical protein
VFYPERRGETPVFPRRFILTSLFKIEHPQAFFMSGHACEHVRSMGLDINLLERLKDRSVRSDHVGDTIGVTLIRIGSSVVVQSYTAFRIGKQLELKVELPGERPIFLDRIEADPQYDHSLGFEVLDSVPEPFSFDGSPGGVGFGIKPQNHGLAGKVRKLDRLTVLILGAERRSFFPYRQHTGSPHHPNEPNGEAGMNRGEG